MRMRMLKGGLLIVLIAAVAMPARAGRHDETIEIVRGAELTGTVLSGDGRTGTVKLFIQQVDYAHTEGMVSIVPAPTSQAAPQAPLPSVYEGCITIKFGSTTDTGCRVLGPAVLVKTDPVFNEGSVIFTVESKRVQGRKLSATLQLVANGAPGAGQEGGAPTITPGPPADNYVEGDGAVLFERAMDIVVGSVRSEIVGGGPIKSGAARMYQGVQYQIKADTTCPIFLALVFQGCAV